MHLLGLIRIPSSARMARKSTRRLSRTITTNQWLGKAWPTCINILRSSIVTGGKPAATRTLRMEAGR